MKKINSLSIKNSSFFEEDFSVIFSEKLNCLMGGRGTGKSTLLHFIQAALNNSAEEDIMISNILRANLLNGIIEIEVEDEQGKVYEIFKTFGDDSLINTLPGKKNISLESLEDVFECDIYPALRIEQIGLNSKDRLKLIDKRIRNEVANHESEIKKIRIALRQNAVSIRSENARVVQIKEQLLNFKTVEEDLKRQREEKPEDIKQNEQEEFEKADGNEKIRNAEKRYVLKALDKLKETLSNLQDNNEEIKSFRALNSNISTFINRGLVDKIKEEFDKSLDKVIKDNETNINLIKESITKAEKLYEDLRLHHQTQQSEFVKLKQKFDKHKEYINKYNQLSQKVEDKKVLEKEIGELENKRAKVKDQRKVLVEQLNEQKRLLFINRKKIVDELNKELEGSVKITLTYGGITGGYETQLRNALKGSNLRYNAIIPYIVQNLTPDMFAKIIHERDFESLKTIAQIDGERSKAIIESLYESEDIYEIENFYCEDLPEFFLKVDSKGNKDINAREHYKKTDELSTGQRCTTVLPIVFAVSDNPLLIDQPEDNLDNKYISDAIHKIIRDQKEKRQLIFITHNPNIPVLSDSDHNVFLNYDDKKSKVEDSGTIEDVKENILTLLEGGKEAFEKRMELYGENV